MFKSNGPVLMLNFVIVFLLCCKGLHDKLLVCILFTFFQQHTFPAQLAVFDSYSRSNIEGYKIKCESQQDNHTLFFINLSGCKCTSFNKRNDNSCLAFLLSLLILASGDLQVNFGLRVNGPEEGDSEVGSIYPCAAFESNITWSRIAVYSETCCIWFPVDCQDIGISSFQALQDSNVSRHCLSYNAINYHSVSSNFLEDLIISNRFEPTSHT